MVNYMKKGWSMISELLIVQRVDTYDKFDKWNTLCDRCVPLQCIHCLHLEHVHDILNRYQRNRDHWRFRSIEPRYLSNGRTLAQLICGHAAETYDVDSAGHSNFDSGAEYSPESRHSYPLERCSLIDWVCDDELTSLTRLTLQSVGLAQLQQVGQVVDKSGSSRAGLRGRIRH